MEFRDAVKLLRKELGITQVELAMGLKMNAITIGRWENGKTVPTRSISAVLLDYARGKGASKECLDILTVSINAAFKNKLGFDVNDMHDLDITYLSMDRIKTIFANLSSGVSIVVYNENGEMQDAFANDRYYQLFGYTKEQFTNELSDPHDTTYFEDREDVAVAFTKVKETKQPATYRYRIVKRDKSIAYVRCNSSVTQIDGERGFVIINILTDITESAQTEYQAIVAGKRLDAIMKNMNSAVTASIVKADGTVDLLFYNDLYYQLFGYTKEQFFAEVPDLFKLAHPDDIEALRKAAMGLNNIGDSKELVYRGITRDGKIKWFKARISIMTFPDAEGPVQLAVYSDISDILSANEKLAAQHRQIEGLLNDTPSGIAIVEVDPSDIAGSINTTYYNDRFFSFSGYTRSEYESILKQNELALVFKEDLSSLHNDIEKICKSKIGEAVDTLIRGHTKDGGFRWLLLTGQLTERRGSICVINIVLIDITQREEAISRQRISDEMFRIAAETDKRALITYDVKKNLCRVESRTLFSAKYGQEFEYVPQSLIDAGITSKSSENEIRKLFNQIREGKKEVSVTLELKSAIDKYEWFDCNATTVFDDEGIPDHAVLVLHNVTEQRVKEAVYKKWQQSIASRPIDSYTLFRSNLSRDASLDEREGNLLKVSFGSDVLSFNERTRRYSEEFVLADDREAYCTLLNSETLLSMYYCGEHFATLDYREIDKNGDIKWRKLTVETVEYPNSTDIQAFLLYEDIDEKKRAEIAALELAQSDPLTGALNRVAFEEKVNEIIDENPNTSCALIMLDLDGFKQLNDTFGHAAGDQALQDVAALLRSYTRNGDLVCRLGGDEFLVWMRDIPYDAVIAKTAQQMCENIHKAYSQEVLLSASAGIAVYPRDGHSYDELYPNADKALYKVKQSGKGTYAFFSVTVEEQTAEVTEAVSAVVTIPAKARAAKRRMLIVDDNEASRVMLSDFFKNEFLIETAKNGTEAMIRLRHFGVSISVVLLDLLMPGVDGFTVLRRMQNDVDLRTIPAVVVTGDDAQETLLKAFELGAAEYVTKPVDADIIRMRVQSVISKAENERLRAQNSYLMLQRDEEVKYRTVLESTGTVVVEYDWRNHIFIYDRGIEEHIAGNYDHRSLWQVLLSDMVADSADVKLLQDTLIGLSSNRELKQKTNLLKFKTPKGVRHWFRVNMYKNVDTYGLAEKLIITFNDVHEEVLANDRLLFQATRDELTGLYNRTAFLEKAAELIASQEPGYYVMACIDIEKFKVINDRYGTEKGDAVLRHVAASVGGFITQHKGVCCRYAADRFAVLYPSTLRDTAELAENHKLSSTPNCINRPLRLCIGRCLIDDISLPVTAIFDRADMAENLAKGRYDTYIVDFDESIRDTILHEQQIVGDMAEALKNGEFEPWFQPQYNHATGALIGAEALVRWHKDGRIIFPNEFIPIFEKNGFIYEVDRSIWRSVCALLRRWLDEGKDPLPVSVNISRHDMFQDDFISVITDLIAEYNLPTELLRLEITESAFSAETKVFTEIAGKLIAAGFTVEIDDFGSGYSSLNTLKDVPASILKLDMRFFENTENSARGGNIVESVVRMAKWLGMAVIAEGVEDKGQADYLKSIGCYYIQGYFYSKPVPVDIYEKLMLESPAEKKLSRLQTLESLDSNLFWDPKSMETLIFNSYVGGAFIFELDGEKTEVLRANERYFTELGSLIQADTPLNKAGMRRFLKEDEMAKAIDVMHRAIESKHEETCELCLTDGTNKEYIRLTGRVIAHAENRWLFYAVIQNITERRILERERTESAEQLSIIMSNVNGGVSAIEINDDGTSQLIFHNDKYYELYGYTRAEKGETELDPMSFIIPEDFPAVMEKVRKLKADGQPTVIDYGIIKQDGCRAQIRANASIMYMEGYGTIITSVLTDITEQRTLEEQLRAVVDNINGGVTATYVRNRELKFVFSNDNYYEILGYTREQYDAEVKSVYDLIHADDRIRVQKLFEKAIHDEKSYTLEYRIIRRNGSTRYILCNASIMHIFGVIEPIQLAVFNDITEIREAQIKEQSLTRQIQTIIKNINGGVTATVVNNGDNVEFIFANDGYYELLGYTKESFEEERVNAFDFVLSEDREKVLENIARIERERRSETYEYRCRKRDGSVIWVQTSNTVMSLPDINDTVLLGITTDITALRRAEKEGKETSDRLSAVMNSMTSGITAVTIDDKKRIRFLFANDRYYQLHGLDIQDKAHCTLRDVFSMIHADDRKSVHEIVASVNEHGQAIGTEYRIICTDGSTRYIRMEITVTNLVGIDTPVQVAIYTDVTEEKKSNEQIRFLNESAGEILAQPDSEIAINDTLKKLLDYFDAERTYIFEFDGKTQVSANTYEICASGIKSAANLLDSIPYDKQVSWFETFKITGFMAIPDATLITDEEKTLRELLIAHNIRSFIVAPLWRDGVLIGYIGVDNPAKAVDQVSRLVALSDYIAVLLTRRDLMESVKNERRAAQQLMNDTPGGFIRMELFENRAPAVVTVNDGLCKMIGMTRAEVMEAYGDNLYACLSDDDADSAPAEIASAYESGGQYTSTCKLRKKDGSLLWVMLFGRFVHGEAGRLYLNAYFTDITEKKNAEELQSELLENLPSGAALFEFDGEKLAVIHINKHYWELVGRSVLSKEKISVFGAFHPEDRNIVSDELKSAIRQGRNAACVARILCGDDSYKPFSITANIVSKEQGSYLLYVTLTPISDEEMTIQKMLPIALSTIVSSTDDMSYVKDKSLRYICVSRSIAEMAGAESPRDLIGKTASEVYDNAFASRFDDDDRLIIQTGKPVMRAIEHIPTKDGSVRLARTSKYPILDTAGNAIGVYCVSHDITTQKEKESQLELLTDTIPGGLAAFSISSEGISTVYFNDGFYAYSGYTHEEYLKMTEKEPLALMIPEDRAILLDMVHNFIANKKDGMTGNCSYRCRTKNGDMRWMTLNAALSQISDDKYVLNVVQFDVTERMNAEKRQSDLLDNLPFGAAMYEFDGKTLSALHLNKQYATLVNRDVNRVTVGYDPVGAIYPADRKLVFEEIMNAIAENRNGVCDIRLLYGNNEYRLFHLDANIVPKGDGKYTLYVAYDPVTDKEQEFKITSERLKLLSDNIPGGIATFRCMPGNIEPIYFNDGICDLTEYPREEFESYKITVLGLIFDEDNMIIRKQIELLMQGKTALDASFRIHTKSGGYKWVECMASVTGKENDNAFIINAVLTDVTEHQEERERLRVSEELNRLAIDQSGKIIARYDVAARTLTLPYTTPAIYEVPQVLNNMPYEQVSLGRISPDTADAYCKVFERIDNGEASGEAVYQQNSTLGWRWLKSKFTTVFANNGKPVSAVITFEDITEQREKEAVYSRWQNAMAERSEDSYTIVRCNLNKSNIIDSWDGKLLRTRFADPEQSFNSRTEEYSEHYVYEEDRSIFRSFLNSDTMLAEYHRRHRSDSIDYRELNEDGSVRWLRLSVDLVEYPDSKDVEAYMLFENIDEQKHEELSTLHRAETDPLTGVLNRTTFSERVNYTIKHFGSATNHALFMLDVDGFKQINDVFGHGAGDEALVEISNALTHFCRKDDLVGRLGGDEFVVFIGNIISEKDAAKKAQQICNLTRKTLGLDVHISVSIGIALYPKNGSAFDSLYKVADQALYRTKKAGKDGYSFKSGNPVIEAEMTANDKLLASVKVKNQKAKSRRILIVDDDKASQAILNSILNKNYSIETAEDGVSALEKLHHYGTAISVVLLDLTMPGMSGFEVLEKMQSDERTRTIPVVVVSADDDRETALRVIREGASDFVTKPIDPDLLRIRVESAISKSENERLRVQNSYLAIRNTEVKCYRSALERTGTMVITTDSAGETFTYSPSVSKQLGGRYDERSFWTILTSDEVTDKQTVENIRQLVQDISVDKERMDGSMTVRLKTVEGIFRIFELDIFKEIDDYNPAVKMIMTLRAKNYPSTKA